MYLLTFHVIPAATHPERNEIGGAFVNCWIERPTLDDADAVARQMIDEDLWDIQSRDEACPISRSSYLHKPAGLEYYEQALIDKEVLVFYKYPIEDREE